MEQFVPFSFPPFISVPNSVNSKLSFKVKKKKKPTTYIFLLLRFLAMDIKGIKGVYRLSMTIFYLLA